MPGPSDTAARSAIGVGVIVDGGVSSHAGRRRSDGIGMQADSATIRMKIAK
jgi:hypothetical protein